MPKVEEDLLRCANDCYSLDMKMEEIYRAEVGDVDNPKPLFGGSKPNKEDEE